MPQSPPDRYAEFAGQPLTPPQQRALDEIVSGKQQGAGPPALIWLQSPEFALRGQRLGEFVRFDICLPKHLAELAILVVGGHWGARYAWHVHAAAALKSGLDPAIVDAIAQGSAPAFSDPQEQLVYDFAFSLNKNKKVPDALFRAAVDTFGKQGVVELIGLMGYYTMIAMTLNTFEVPVPDDTAG